MKKKTYEEAKKCFENQGRADILLLEEEYESWRKKATFLDLVTGEKFSAIPKMVFYQKSAGPKRAKEQRKKTNMEKYGNPVPFHGNTEAAIELKNKRAATILEKYGTSHPSKNTEIREKVTQTVFERHRVENVGQLKKQVVLETGEYIADWFGKQKEPKPCSFQSFGAIFLFGKGKSSFSVEELHGFLAGYRENTTKLEREASRILAVPHFNKQIKKGLRYRPDFKINDDFYINVDGLFWHSIKTKTKTYHYQLREALEKSNIRLFQFREDELYEKEAIIKSMVSNQEKESVRVYARKTEVGTVLQKVADDFLEKNHLMGSIKARHVGLFSGGELISLLSFKMKGEVLVIERFASKTFVVVVGGLSKLLTYCKKQLSPSRIESWVDLRYGNGGSLKKCGFQEVRTTLSWKWTNGKQTFHRLRCRANMDERKLPEKEYANELGWYKIYDAGQRLFALSC